MIIVPIKNATSKMLDLAVLYAMGGHAKNMDGDLTAILPNGLELSFRIFNPSGEPKQITDICLSNNWLAKRFGNPTAPMLGKHSCNAISRYFAITVLGEEFKVPPELENRIADWLIWAPGWRQESTLATNTKPDEQVAVMVRTLSGAALNWAVAKCEGALHPLGNVNISGKELLICVGGDPGGEENRVLFNPSADWAQGGPIFEREISNHDKRDGYFYCARFPTPEDWRSGRCQSNNPVLTHGNTLLEASMRCYVISKLGEEVKIPAHLLETAPTLAIRDQKTEDANHDHHPNQKCHQQDAGSCRPVCTGRPR